MAKFSDIVTLKLGDVQLKVKRLTLKEIKETHALFSASGATFDDDCQNLIRSHVTDLDGKAIDPEELSLAQVRELMRELTGIPEGSPLSDFIGLLS